MLNTLSSLLALLPASLLLTSVPAANGQNLGPPSARAQELGLTSTWYSSWPSAPVIDSGQTRSDLTNDWNVVSFPVGQDDVQFAPDPFDSTNNATVLQVFYQQGSFAPSKGIRSGAEFLANPLQQSSSVGYRSALLSYKVGFPQNYTWVLAGKLPGLYGGPPGAGCSGGNQSDGKNCFSVRMMWRQAGIGEAYAYIPADANWCTKNGIICNDEYGKSIGRGSFSYMAGGWTQIELYVQLNDPSSYNGVITVWVDGKQMFSLTDVPIHATNLIQIESIFFSTFFGGSTSKYMTPTDQNSYFKDVQLSVGSPVPLTTDGDNGGLPPSGSGILRPDWWFVGITSGLFVVMLL